MGRLGKLKRQIIEESNKRLLDENTSMVIDTTIINELTDMGFKSKKLDHFDEYTYRSTLKNCDDNTPKTLEVIHNKDNKDWWIQRGVCGTIFKKEKFFDIPKHKLIDKIKELKRKFN